MTEIQDSRTPRRHDDRLLLSDLACICGTLSEIMTAWRRAKPLRPELPLRSLISLQDAARALAADIAAAGIGAAGATPRGTADGRAAGRRDPALSVAARFSLLTDAIADTRTRTGAPGVPVVDHGLWELLGAATLRAQAQLVALAPGLGPGLAGAGRQMPPDRRPGLAR